MTDQTVITSPEWSSEIADWYSENYGTHPSHSHALDDCKRLLSNQQSLAKILDIGCGNGSLVFRLAGQLNCEQVIGVDPTPRMIEIAKTNQLATSVQSDVQFFECGAERLPFEADTFDILLAIYSVHHWRNIPAGLDEVKRVLKPKGHFYVMVEERPDLDQAYSELGIKTTIQDQGFALIEQTTHQSEHYHCYSLVFTVNDAG